MMMMMNGDEYTDSAAMTAAECFSLNSLSKKKKNKNKRRFSDDQIRSLETIFESESKLEPRKKLQLARELGLQPRQIAIWFQNKRARFKSKQLEREYSILRANYNTLASQFEATKKDKQGLQVQLQKLKDAMRKSGEKEKRSDDGGDDVKSQFGVKPSLPVEKSEHRIGVHLLSDGDSSSIKAETHCGVDEKAKPSLSFDRSEHGVGVLSDEDSSMKAEYFGLDEEPPLLDMVEPADSSLTSPENWGSLDSSGLLDDQSGTSYQWWDFWS